MGQALKPLGDDSFPKKSRFQCFQSRKRLLVPEDCVNVLLRSIHVVSIARNSPILSHLEDPTRGNLRGLKPEYILGVYHQNTL